jgi:hypothetical protein
MADELSPDEPPLKRKTPLFISARASVEKPIKNAESLGQTAA